MAARQIAPKQKKFINICFKNLPLCAMLKSQAQKPFCNPKASSKNSFEDSLPASRFLCSQVGDKLRTLQNQKLSLLQVNKEKVKKRNSELMKLFNQAKPEYMNLEILQKSQFMKTNQIFYYLVNSLKKQRQGMISVDTISEEKAKAPKPIENKIRQFVYHSLQQALLMSQKQVKETKYFERLLKWFTEVFKQTEMKLSFKLEPPKKDAKQHDPDWIIRNTYKSSMPEEVGEYQRKMLDTNQIVEFVQEPTRRGHRINLSDFQKFQESDQKAKLTLDSFHTQNGLEKKLFTQPINYSSMHQKSNELLPILARKGFHAELSKLNQEKQLKELRVYEVEWKKLKSHFREHLPKNLNKDQSLKQPSKMGQMSLYNPKSNKNKRGKENSSSFSLEPKIFDRIQAAKLGVTLTEFKKNKENILKENNSVTYESPVYHPFLTSSYFHDIKKKKLQTLRKNGFPKEFKYNAKKTDESEDMCSSNGEKQNIQTENLDEMFNPALPVQNTDEPVENIDGLCLSQNPLEKSMLKTKKNEGKK